jgi:flagellar biogenesis protein FliO
MNAIIKPFLGTMLAYLQTEGQLAAEQFQSGRSLLWMFVQTIFALGFVCLLAYVVLRVALPRLNFPGTRKSMVHIIDRASLDQKRSLYVIEVTGRWLMIGASEGGLQLIGELDPEAAEQEAEAIKAAAAGTRDRRTVSPVPTTARTAFADVLARMVHKRQ